MSPADRPAAIGPVREYVEKEMGGGDAALITVAALVVGPNINRIAKFVGLPRETVRPYAHRLRENGVWRGGHIICEGDRGPDGVETALWVGVAEGWFEVSHG